MRFPMKFLAALLDLPSYVNSRFQVERAHRMYEIRGVSFSKTLSERKRLARVRSRGMR